MKLYIVIIITTENTRRTVRDGHLDFHTALEL